MKAATRYSHSFPKLACPGGQDGIIISTNKLNRVVNVDVENRRMTVESGVLVGDLINEAARNGLALLQTPNWWGLTVAGLLATGAHGSSLWGKGGAVHEYVVSMRIVTPATAEEGYAKVRSLSESDEELDAAKVSLGVLGVVSQVTFEVEPMFKRAITYVTKSDADLGDELIRFGKEHEFADLSWYPSQKKAAFRIDDRVPFNRSGDGLSNILAYRSAPSAQLTTIRGTEELREATRDAKGKCLDAQMDIRTAETSAYGFTNNGANFTGYPVIGQNNRLQSSGPCLDSKEDALLTVCPWDSRFQLAFYHDTTFTISLSNVSSFIKDVQKLVKLEPRALCGVDLYEGFHLRYIKASSAYLGRTKDSVDFDILYYRSKDPLAPRLFEDILEEIEQIGLFKYGGLPHWGKNRNLAFNGVIKKYPNASKFVSVKRKYDPQGLFSNEWTDQILGLKKGTTIMRDGCALEGLCICSEDRHCAPTKKYFCRPGKVYKKARVCAFEG
ncbi:probable L-gulonolactone oxidase 6 [Neltuma alba]|uniref:probable L-gulonolactone oxidase 6 n=1 Tax=Neltuma alba TaxID=207710 RepID=UPI0010A48A41|nr:probable L-gulonolactone oxidase 6 [Prosopis alba]